MIRTTRRDTLLALVLAIILAAAAAWTLAPGADAIRLGQRVCANDPNCLPPGLVVTAHGVVTQSNLPTCSVEDGSTGPIPCTWNVGPDFTPDDGLSFWIDKPGGATSIADFHYVWNGSPLTGHPNRDWMPTPHIRCWWGLNNIGHCPNGNTIQ